MTDDTQVLKSTDLPGWGMVLANMPWMELIGQLWKIGKKVMRGLTSEGVYEVLDYESTLEILDREGKLAIFKKLKKIRYLQDNIIAFQDYAWGDGKILHNYETSRGKPVDCYRSGYKTYILLSLREVKNKGDIDEFNIQWDLRKGFLTEDGYWATDISNRTKHIKINVIFPKSRPPLTLSIEESNRKNTRALGRDAQMKLPDGRWLVSWETDKPKMYELYVLRWTW